jgi:putative ubiquitin-RnfH superfamily antitoxin RatB of RatAB toxin-antitoxin module
MSSTIRVEVAYARPDRQWLIALTLPAGATLLDAVMQSGLPDEIPDLPALAGNVGIHGLPCPPTQPLADGDRVEIYRPLTIDPKDARRARAAKARK